MTVEYREIPWAPRFRVGSDGTIWTRWIKAHPRQHIKDWVLGDEWTLVPQRQMHNGYMRVSIAGYARLYVHCLVMEMFVGPCLDGQEVRHFPDGSKTNNALSNLQYGSHEQNMNDPVVHPNAKIDVERALALRKEGWSIRKLCELFDVSRSSMKRSLRRHK